MLLTRWALMHYFLSVFASRYQVIVIFNGLDLEKAISYRCLSVCLFHLYESKSELHVNVKLHFLNALKVLVSEDLI